MDKPVGQTSVRRGAGAWKPARSGGASTRASILLSARRRLIGDGCAPLNVRPIARDAGVKQPRLQRLQRQARRHEGVGAAGTPRRQARKFHDAELESGFKQLLVASMAASVHGDARRGEFLPRSLTGHRRIDAAVTQRLGPSRLDLPVSAQVITAWIGWFWTGKPRPHGARR